MMMDDEDWKIDLRPVMKNEKELKSPKINFG